MTKKDFNVYLDYNATTPCDLRVVQKMLPYFNEIYGNPANGYHLQGRNSLRAIDEAREEIARLIEAGSHEILFTSGATESNNLAILGIARNNSNRERYRIVVSAIEHKAVLYPCYELENEGYEVIRLPVDSNGIVSFEDAKNVINEHTLLVSIQLANNEIGTIQPIEEVVAFCHDHGVFFHCDAAQAIGKVPVSVSTYEVDLLSFSSHKIYGPKGVGALYVREGKQKELLKPLWYGGGQEMGIRSGTMNVPGIVGFGEACHILREEEFSDIDRTRMLRDQLESNLEKQIPQLRINAKHANRLPNTSSLTFQGIEADALLFNSPMIMCGTGSACTSGAVEPSHVLTAIGLSREDANSTIRISFGRFNIEGDVFNASNEISKAYRFLTST